MSSPSAPSGTVSPGLDALLHSAAFAPIENLGWLRITGSDRVRWLNGMVTNNIAALKPGEGNYNFFLNAQGRIQADCTAWMQEDSILLQTAADRIPALIALLDHFIIMDDVELTDVTQEREGVAIIGSHVTPVLEKFVSSVSTLRQLQITEFQWIRHRDLFLHADSPEVPRFEIWLEEPGDAYTLSRELREFGVSEATTQDLEHLRILSGTPLYGTDIRDKDLPQETNQDARALHFAKGCYLGQEIVERIRSRGAVHRTFTGFILEGEVPAAGVALTLEEKPIGELTSVARIGDRTLALGYIRREALDRNARIQYPGGIATPSALPFPITTKP